MGTCATQLHSKRNTYDSFDVSPADTASLKDRILPILAFYVLISDIKIKNKSFISLKFRIDGVHQFNAPVREVDRGHRAYWKISHSFQFYMTQYQLRNKFLEIEAYDKHGKMVGSLKLNMYVLWVGPYHLDFQFQLPDAENCRISLNFKISQGIHLIIENISTQMIPNEPAFVGDRFTYSLQAIIGQQLEVSVCPYIVQVRDGLIDNKQSKGAVDNYFVSSDKIVWSQVQQNQLPKFDKKIAFYEIYSSSLHISFFRVLPGLQQRGQARYEIQSQCYISLAKMMSLDYILQKDVTTHINYYERKIILTQKTWLHGKEKGSVKIFFKFSLQYHLKQMQACVRTQKGILTSSPVFNVGTENCAQIQGLKVLSDEIQKEFIHLDQNTQKRSNFIMIKENILRIQNLLIKELTLLQKSSKESILFYQYKNQLELYKGQRFLIDLAFKAFTFIHEDHPSICEICWTILTAILKRGQFKLSHMAFSKEDKANIQNKNINATLRAKMDTALKYQQLLYYLLKQTLSLLVYKGEEAQRIFAQSFCSYAYFRIPSFRENILSVISRKDDPQIRQWRGTEVNLYQQLEDSYKRDEFFDLLFDWQNNFYKPLMGQQKFKINNSQLQIILVENQWKNRLGKRSGAFFTFVYNLVQEIEYVCVVSKYIKWHQMPGYNRLLHAFLVEMKKGKIKSYTQRFKKCCIKLISNQKLLNIFVVILFNKTNINDPQTVQATFELIDSFLSRIQKNLRPIPGTFDYKYLLSGMKMVLSSDLSDSICQVLILIYNHLNTFSNQFALELAFYLLSKPFFRFFFSWSYNTRHVFHVLLAMRISRMEQVGSQKSITENNYVANMKKSIHQRYLALFSIMQKKQTQLQSSKSIQNVLQEKSLYKKMRSTLSHRRKHIKKVLKQQDCQISEFHDITLPNILSTKSLSSRGQMVMPYSMIYFKEEEIVMIGPRENELAYAVEALAEYNQLRDQIQSSLMLDPKFCPQLRVKKLIDEKQLGPPVADQW